MGKYTQVFSANSSAIQTSCIVFPLDAQISRKRYYSENALWDTGAEISVISNKIVKELGLNPIGEGELGGIGGDSVSSIYEIHLGLPSGELIQDLLVMSDDLQDHDILIGMDVISQCDLAITHPQDLMKFTYERPSRRDLDFTKE